MAISRPFGFFDPVPDDPFYGPRKPLWMPRAMACAPVLDSARRCGPVERRFALLLNPFYPKSPHGSFGKHVLTPSLALTSIAGATPPGWRVQYWDENLLQGPPPADPLPQVVGITVHLTFARRAYELAAWYRARGSDGRARRHARPVLPRTRRRRTPMRSASATACRPGRHPARRRAGRAAPRYEATFERDYDLDPPPRRDLLPRDGFLTTTSIIATRGCRNRCAFCYLATERAAACRTACAIRTTSPARSRPTDSRTPCSSTTTSARRRDYLRRLCRALRPLEKIWSAAVTLDVTDDPRAGARDGARRLHRRVHRIRDADRREPGPRAQAHAARRGLRAARAASSTSTASRSTAASSSASTTTGGTPSRRWRSGSRRTGWSARRSTSSRRTRARRSSVSSTPSDACCTATGISTTPRTWCFGRST